MNLLTFGFTHLAATHPPVGCACKKSK